MKPIIFILVLCLNLAICKKSTKSTKAPKAPKVTKATKISRNNLMTTADQITGEAWIKVIKAFANLRSLIKENAPEVAKTLPKFDIEHLIEDDGPENPYSDLISEIVKGDFKGHPDVVKKAMKNHMSWRTWRQLFHWILEWEFALISTESLADKIPKKAIMEEFGIEFQDDEVLNLLRKVDYVEPKE